MESKIIKYFRENDLPAPVTIRYAGKWVNGDVWGATCGIFRIKKYAVYCINGEIHSVRARG